MTTGKKSAVRKKVGDITEEFIETSRADLDKQKQELERTKWAYISL